MRVLMAIPPSRLVYSSVGPDLGLLYAVRALKNAGHAVRVVDGLLDPSLDLVREIDAFGADAVGIKSFSKDMVASGALLARVKEARPHVLTLVGGPHTSGEPVGTLDHFPGIDYVFRGESEVGLPKLLTVLDEDPAPPPEVLAGIEGLGWRKEGRGVANCAHYPADLDALGLPAWEDMPPDRYPRDYNNKPVVPVITTRGCPYSCTYCAGHLNTGKKLRHHSMDYLVEMLRNLWTTYRVPYFSIWDDNFTLHQRFAREFCEAYLRSGLPMTWGCPNGVRIDTLDRELLVLMERAGCRVLRVAVEAGTQHIMDHMKRELDMEEIRDKLRLVKECTRMEVHGFFIIGYPEETRSDVLATLRFSRELPLDQAAFFLYTPHPGTLYWDRVAHDEITGLTTFDYDRPSIPLADVDLEGLKALQRKAYLGFYLRPRILTRNAAVLLNPTNLPTLARRVWSAAVGS
ncbi:MAG: radical SAM protein [bacterium]